MRKNSRTLDELPDQPEKWRGLNPPKGRASAKPWQNDVILLNVPFIVGTTSAQILQANKSRVYLFIQNKSASSMYVVFNNSATTFAGVLLQAGEFYEPFYAGWSSLNIIGAAANLNGICIEGVRG